MILPRLDNFIPPSFSGGGHWVICFTNTVTWFINDLTMTSTLIKSTYLTGSEGFLAVNSELPYTQKKIKSNKKNYTPFSCESLLHDIRSCFMSFWSWFCSNYINKEHFDWHLNLFIFSEFLTFTLHVLDIYLTLYFFFIIGIHSM